MRPTMVYQSRIFNDKWIDHARMNSPETSWARAVIEMFDSSGQVYLSTLRLWFDRFPLSSKQKRGLHVRLESLRDDEHLGGANELAWWAFMLREGLKGVPLPPSTAPRPDFQLKPPVDCLVEVSTLNVSQQDKAKLETGAAVALDHAETIRRVLGKLTAEKLRQLKYAADHGKPSVLVFFDYTTWSGSCTLFFRTLAQFLLGNQLGFNSFPPELSAIVYLERRVLLDGRIALSRHRSAVYYNPLALYPLSVETFASLNQFRLQLVFVESRSTEQWILL